MKKITLLLSAALIMGSVAFAGDGDKGGCCSKGKKEACHSSKDKKDGDKKGTSAHVDTKKAESKEAKAQTVKKS